MLHGVLGRGEEVLMGGSSDLCWPVGFVKAGFAAGSSRFGGPGLNSEHPEAKLCARPAFFYPAASCSGLFFNISHSARAASDLLIFHQFFIFPHTFF